MGVTKRVFLVSSLLLLMSAGSDSSAWAQRKQPTPLSGKALNNLIESATDAKMCLEQGDCPLGVEYAVKVLESVDSVLANAQIEIGALEPVAPARTPEPVKQPQAPEEVPVSD